MFELCIGLQNKGPTPTLWMAAHVLRGIYVRNGSCSLFLDSIAHQSDTTDVYSFLEASYQVCCLSGAQGRFCVNPYGHCGQSYQYAAIFATTSARVCGVPRSAPPHTRSVAASNPSACLQYLQDYHYLSSLLPYRHEIKRVLPRTKTCHDNSASMRRRDWQR